jgi:DNA-binding transcriptional MocR family regulator
VSVEAFKWAKAEIARCFEGGDPLPPAEAFVLWVLGDHYNETWKRAWPSQARIARATGFSVKTVTRAVDGLRERGLVATEEWVLNEGAYRMPYRYLLPRYRPLAGLARELPVLAFAWSDASSDFDHEDMARVPGSNLMVERELFDLDLP